MTQNISNYISKLGIGTVQFGLDYGISNTNGKLNQEEVKKILDFAKEHQITYLDTARAYGESEKVVGNSFNKNLKDYFKVISKAVPQTKDIYQEVENSLVDLQVNNLYGYLFHDFDTYQNNTSLWEELKENKQKGKIKKIGFSLYYPSQLEILFEQNIDFDIVQIPYNLFDRRFEPYLEKLKAKNIEIHIRSVFLQGLFFLDTQKLPSHFHSIKSKLENLENIAQKNQLDKATLPLFFVLNNPFIDIALLGLSSLEDLKQNLKVIENFEKVEKLGLDFTTFEEQNEEIILPFLWKK